jgi:hypothetical protein
MSADAESSHGQSLRLEPHTPPSSPLATGAAGVFFEQHVDAGFLAYLLVGGVPPFLKDCQTEKIYFASRAPRLAQG